MKNLPSCVFCDAEKEVTFERQLSTKAKVPAAGSASLIYLTYETASFSVYGMLPNPKMCNTYLWSVNTHMLFSSHTLPSFIHKKFMLMEN